MPRLTIITDATISEVPFSLGASVREILETAGIGIRSGCRGNGACGLCLVRIESGVVPGPTRAERLTVPAEQLADDARLACQVVPEGDLRLRVIGTPARSGWRDLDPESTPCLPSPSHHAVCPRPDDHGYGLAVDVGTTHISLSLWDLAAGRRLWGRIGPNPQSGYGSDVVTRLLAAAESSDATREIAELLLAGIAEGLRGGCVRHDVDPGEIARVTLVGNTAMLVLLTQTDTRAVLEPRAWTRPVACRAADSRTMASALGLPPQAEVEVVSPLAGFVGSDLLAGVLATRLMDAPGGLLVDFGTNSELALWDGRTLWATSAAGGPAFEGSGIQCGLPAEPGAIYRVDRQQDSAELLLGVIGGGTARGLCGSGLVDLIACLRSTGGLTRTGKLLRVSTGEGFLVQSGDPTIRLTGQDVDLVQRAKAAIGVGIRSLLARAQRDAVALKRVCVGGAFGQHLGVGSAQRIGLLPDLDPERVELCGNTALAGCERLLVSPTGAAEVASLRARATVIDLSREPDFETLFLENLYLEPLKADGP